MKRQLMNIIRQQKWCPRMIKGKGGSVGPALDSIVGSKGEEFFIQKLKNPQFNNPSSPMPKMPLNGAEIDALLDYLKNL